MVVTSAASPHQNSRSNRPRLDAVDDDQATMIAPVPGTFIYAWGGSPFLKGAVAEVRDRAQG